jgi:hypothetical protein
MSTLNLRCSGPIVLPAQKLNSCVIKKYLEIAHRQPLVIHFLFFVFPDVAHHDIDEGVLDEAEEHEDGAGGHEHVYSLQQKIQGGHEHVYSLQQSIQGGLEHVYSLH